MEQRQYQWEQKKQQQQQQQKKPEWSVFETSVSVLNFIIWNNFRFTEKLQN